MKKHLGLAIALLALVLPIAAHGGSVTRQTVDVTGWVEGAGPTTDVLGNASLVRTDNGISFNFQTSGLPAGQPVTIWWIILGPNGPVSAQFADGHIVGNNGVASFAGHLAEGDTSGVPLQRAQRRKGTDRDSACPDARREGSGTDPGADPHGRDELRHAGVRGRPLQRDLVPDPGSNFPRFLTRGPWGRGRAGSPARPALPPFVLRGAVPSGS